MIQEEKLEKIRTDFSKLSGEQQDYIIGIMQALVFANSTQDAKANPADEVESRT